MAKTRGLKGIRKKVPSIVAALCLMLALIPTVGFAENATATSPSAEAQGLGVQGSGSQGISSFGATDVQETSVISLPQVMFGNVVVAPSGNGLAYVLGSSGITMTVGGEAVTFLSVGDPDSLLGGNPDAGSVEIPYLLVGKEVTLTFDGLAQGMVVSLEKVERVDGQVVGTTKVLLSGNTHSFTVSENLSDLNVSLVNTVEVSYQNSAVEPVSGLFIFGTTGLTAKAKVRQADWSTSGTILAAEGDNASLTFDGIPAGQVVNVETLIDGHKQKRQFDSINPDRTFNFNMGSVSQQIIVSIVPDTSAMVMFENDQVTAVEGTFTFGSTGATCTATVAGDVFRGSEPSIPARIGETVVLTFAGIAAGKAVAVEVQTPDGPLRKTIGADDVDKTFTFVMSSQSRNIDVSVGDANAVVVAFNTANSQYTPSFQTDFATFMYRVNGGVWINMGDGIASGAVQEKAVGDQFVYTMPQGIIDFKVSQPYDASTGKFTNKNEAGAGFMVEYSTPDGAIEQRYPEDFITEYEISRYDTPGRYDFNFLLPFWSLVWSSTPNQVITAEEVLKNGTFRVLNVDTNPVIDAKSSRQAEDGSSGHIVIIDPMGELTATFTPLRGYQILSSTIKDLEGNQINVTPDANHACTFTFNIANNKNMHVCSAFVTAPDTASTTSDSLSGVSVSDSEGAIDSGNLNLEVADAEMTAAMAVSAEKTVGSGDAVGTFDVGLEQFWNQASTTEVWTNQLTELEVPVSFSLELNDSLKLGEGETYQVVRTHEGVSAVVDSAYDASTNTVSVSTKEFSEFTLVKTAAPVKVEEAASAMPLDTTGKISKTSDNLPWGIPAVLAVGGLAAVVIAVRRMRNAK